MVYLVGLNFYVNIFFKHLEIKQKVYYNYIHVERLFIIID